MTNIEEFSLKLTFSLPLLSSILESLLSIDYPRLIDVSVKRFVKYFFKSSAM